MLSQFAGNIANLAQQLVQVGVVTMGFFLVGEGAIGFGAIIACTTLNNNLTVITHCERLKQSSR